MAERDSTPDTIPSRYTAVLDALTNSAPPSGKRQAADSLAIMFVMARFLSYVEDGPPPKPKLDDQENDVELLFGGLSETGPISLENDDQLELFGWYLNNVQKTRRQELGADPEVIDPVWFDAENAARAATAATRAGRANAPAWRRTALAKRFSALMREMLSIANQLIERAKADDQQTV